MTSKEALDELNIILKTNYGTKRYSDIFEENRIKVIERDLEVLEIIKKRRVDVYALEHYICRYHNDDEALENYNKLCCLEQITLSYDEYNLLKEWLNRE